MCDLTNPIFTDAEKAREHLEALYWPDGPACRHCGNADSSRITKLMGKSTRPGVYKCNECAKPFSVTVGTAMERSKIPLNKWLLVMHLMMAGKKGISAHQVHRMVGLSYQTAWFMCHRLREGMRDMSHKATGGLGGTSKIVEVDETYIGGKSRNRAFKEPAPKKAVLSLIERGGHIASFHIANVSYEMVRPLVITNVNRASALMSDESSIYPKIGDEFADHRTINHSANEYARLGGYVHINTAENFYSILKRGIVGIYHSVSEAHLHRYIAEFDFRYNNRSGLGIGDVERAAKAMKGLEGKRLTYRQPREATHA
ncbi:MAG: IS1595 family transposase [Methylocella sp.]|nr:MAG: IS1595 family transposase [Hyphomicrobiales bacterium]